MNNILRRALSLLLVVQAACVSAAQVREENANRIDSLTTRASFDLTCPPGRLVVTNLTSGEDFVRLAGVEGCGQHATYTYFFHANQGTWFMDAASTTRGTAEATKERPAD